MDALCSAKSLMMMMMMVVVVVIIQLVPHSKQMSLVSGVARW
jgi:hypothetical protein